MSSPGGGKKIKKVKPHKVPTFWRHLMGGLENKGHVVLNKNLFTYVDLL